MSIKYVLFDLDGTLLPMDQELFTKAYFKKLAKKLAPLGYDPEKLIDGIWTGTASMVKNDGTCTNEERFWKTFTEKFYSDAMKDKPVFDEFYRNEFQQVSEGCGYTPKAKAIVDAIKAKGCKVVLATNPIFPSVATESRIRWAGLNVEDFELYTTYVNSCFCKPNTAYYTDILDRLGYKAEECLMIGNDVTEDMVAETIGMSVFLLTDCMINKNNKDINAYPHGNFDDLMEFINNVL